MSNWGDLKEVANSYRNITLTLMTWKRPNSTRRIASVSIRQESLRHPSIADWRREYSPEGTPVIPCEWYVSYLSSNPRIGKEFEKFYSYGFEILMPDPNLSPIACASGLLLMLDTIYSHLAWSLWRLLIQENIRFGSEFIYTGFEILTPDPKFYLRRWF